MKIIIIDIETTNFLKVGGSIVEIGISELNLKNGCVKIIYDSVCRESILTKKHREEPFGWIFKNSDLTPEDVRNAPLFENVKIEVQHVINEYRLGCTAYNNVFDFGFLEDRGIKINNKLDCPMKLSVNICKVPPTEKMIKYRPGIKYKTPNVEECFKFFFPNMEYKEKHRAADDSKHEAMIVFKLYEMGVFKL